MPLRLARSLVFLWLGVLARRGLLANVAGVMAGGKGAGGLLCLFVDGMTEAQGIVDDVVLSGNRAPVTFIDLAA